MSTTRDDRAQPKAHVSPGGAGVGQESEAILCQAAFDHAPIPMAITEADGRYVRVNRAMSDLLGQPEEELLRGSFQATIHPDDLAGELARLQRLVNLEVAWYEAEQRLLHPAHGVIWVRERVSLALDDDGVPLIPDEQGGPTYVIRQAIDITAEREWRRTVEEAREEAMAANRAKNEFLSRMSHELRTPLNAVLGFAQLLELEELSPDQESVAHILKGGRHLLALIDEVLDISRIEAGRMHLSLEPVRMHDVLNDALGLVGPLAAKFGIHLGGPTGPARDGHVLADRQRLKQILLNLLSNAVKYNRPDGTVTVSCHPAGTGRFRIDVTDTGPGIRPEHLPLMFTPFERLGAEHTDVEGTGMGLALSRRLAEAMGGCLDLTTAVGEGSTFRVELPVAEGPVERYERLHGNTTEPVPPRPSHRVTVLHIEDNLANATLVERILAQRGDVEVVAAMQGGLGLDLARQHEPGLILLDLHLPDMGGDEVLRRLRADPVTAGIPVIMISADATPGQIQRLLAAGAAAYVTKPINVREFLRLVNDALGPGQ